VRALITGASGQLGIELLRTAPPDAVVLGVSHQECDITREDDIGRAVASHRPDVVINAAAFTAVDAAENSPEEARAVNTIGAGNVARAAAEADARLIHLSTDYVFDGQRRNPYTPDIPTNPLNVYGKTKADGEKEVQRAAGNALIIRSGWLYSTHSRNFLRTVLSALRGSRPLRIVDDQIGVPTSANGLAATVWWCSVNPNEGIAHWSDAGTASWFDFAVAINDIAVSAKLLAAPGEITPVKTGEYPAAARRPAYSVLDSQFLWRAVGKPRGWKAILRQTISEMPLDPA